MTIEDILKWEIGHEADVVLWDRNFEEYWIWSNAEKEKLYDPKEFFRANRCKLTYKGNMVWDIHFDFGKTIEHPVHLDVTALPTNWTWVAIEEDGYVRITTESVNRKITPRRKAIHMHWTEFSPETRVGWRGPIMLWEKLDSLDKVYHTDLEK